MNNNNTIVVSNPCAKLSTFINTGSNRANDRQNLNQMKKGKEKKMY